MEGYGTKPENNLQKIQGKFFGRDSCELFGFIHILADLLAAAAGTILAAAAMRTRINTRSKFFVLPNTAKTPEFFNADFRSGDAIIEQGYHR